MRAFVDGNDVFVVKDDFVNLQVSSAVSISPIFEEARIQSVGYARCLEVFTTELNELFDEERAGRV